MASGGQQLEPENEQKKLSKLEKVFKRFRRHQDSDDIQLTKAYTDAIKDGVEQSTTLRVMVVGNGGVGKSSLTNNLMCDIQQKSTSSTDENSKNEEHDVVKQQTLSQTNTCNSINEPHSYTLIGELQQESTSSTDVHTSTSSVSRSKRSHRAGVFKKRQKKREGQYFVQTFDQDEPDGVVQRKVSRTNTWNSTREPHIEPVSTNGIDVHTCTSSKASGLWKKIEGTASDFEADRLARILQHHKKNKEQPNSPNKITVETNVVTEHCISKATMNKLRDHVLKDGENEQRFVKIWDFGGQFVYYATHQLFHSRYAVYLLVLDASMSLEDMVKDNQYPDQTTTKTLKHYYKFWMHSIQSYVGTDNGDVPPVILVATHTDAVKGGWNIQKETDFFESVRKLFDGSILRNHIQPKSFAVSNTTSGSKEFELLRNYIVEVADKQQSKDKLCQPARWIPLETSITEHVHLRHISLDELRQFDLKNELPIKNEDQLLAFLKLHHSLGDLVYFEDDGLSDMIIIDPQWIINAFRSIITSRIFCQAHSDLRPKWKELLEHAKLTNDLIDNVWSEESNHDFMKYRNKLLRYMSKLGILSKIFEIDIDTGISIDSDLYIVPSLLHTHMPDDVFERILTSSRGTTTALVFAFDNKYVSPTLYHRITAAALGQWKVLVSNGTRLLFDNIGIYELDRVHSGVIERRDASIEIRVINRCKGDINYTHTDRLRRFVKLIIQNEYHRSGVSRAKLYTEHIRCNLNNTTGDNTSPTSELINCEYTSIPCPDNSADHLLDLHSVQKEWQLLNATKLELSCGSLENKESLEQILSEREITKVANALGRNWQVLGVSLGLKKVEIERIELDSPNQTLLQIVNMLTKWSKQECERATMAVLVKQIKDTRYLGVDWDLINNILDELK